MIRLERGVCVLLKKMHPRRSLGSFRELYIKANQPLHKLLTIQGDQHGNHHWQFKIVEKSQEMASCHVYYSPGDEVL